MNQLYDITVTNRSRRVADHQLLSGRYRQIIPAPGVSVPGQPGDLPARVFDDPPVVDVLEGITGDLLLVRAASPIFISKHSHRKQEVKSPAASRLAALSVSVSRT